MSHTDHRYGRTLPALRLVQEVLSISPGSVLSSVGVEVPEMHHWWVIEPFSWKRIKKLPGSRDISWVILLPGGQFGQLYNSDAPSLWTSGASSAFPVTTGSAYGFLTGTWQGYRGYRGYEMIWTRFNKWVELLTNLVQRTARIPFMPRYWENLYQKTATNLDCKVCSNYNTSASSCLERDLFGVDLSWRIQISHL